MYKSLGSAKRCESDIVAQTGPNKDLKHADHVICITWLCYIERQMALEISVWSRKL